MADDVTFTGPLGRTEGADAYIDGVRHLTETVKGVDIHRAIGEADEVCIRYDLVTAAGRIPTVGWYEIHDGKVASVRAYFDPRPILA